MARAKASNKDIADVLSELEQQGWTITGGGTRHFKGKCPNRCRCMVMFASSPSGPNTAKRARQQLRSKTCWKEQTR